MKTTNRWPRGALLCVALLATTLLQSGCAGKRFMSHSGASQEISIAPETATVVFMRPSNYGGAARFFVVNGNGEYMGDMQGREYFVHQLAPGTYDFVGWAENADMTRATLAAGKIYYVLLSVRMGVWTARMSISALTPRREEWPHLAKWMAASRPLVGDFASAREWQEANQEHIQHRIRVAREVWEGFDEEKQGLRTLRPEDGFDSIQH